MSGENEGTEPQDPGTAQEQIEQQLALEQMGPLIPIAGMVPEMMRSMQMATTGGGAGYQFDPAEVDNVIQKLQNVVEKTEKAEHELRNAGKAVQPAPADDGPSTRQAAAVVQSLNKALEHNEALKKYANGFIAKLQSAKAAYGDAEGQNAGNVARQM